MTGDRYPPDVAGDAGLDPSRDVAVVGMACRLPGSVDSPESLWRVLWDGQVLVGKLSGEARAPGVPVPDPSVPGWAALLDMVEHFDAGFFGISPREAGQMDPQQRLLLEVSYEALERAGIPLGSPLLRRAGVFTGVSGSDYGRLLGAAPAEVDAHFSTGQAASIAANRVSYAFDMRGPSVAVDTACSSSLVAVHTAVRSLRAGDCDMALAGGVSVVLAPDMWNSLSRFGMLSPTGRCHSFGAEADGYVRAEGCAVLVLRPLAAALADGDDVIAVVKGSAVNSDGRSNGLTAPNGTAQVDVVRRALTDARVEPAQVSYVEAHGSGTPLGDPIEYGALASVYAARPAAAPTCYVGTIKSNLGHAEAAAGILGLLKLVLCLRHGGIPESLGALPANPRLSTAPGIAVATGRRAWRNGSRQVGAVSSFGFGGTNAHVVVAAADPRPPVPPEPATRALVLPVSARAPAATRELAERYANLLADPDVDPVDVCRTAAVHRTHHPYRAVFVARDRAGLLAAMRRYTYDPPSDMDGPRWRDMVLVFTGQGREFAGMGGWLRGEPAFAAHVARCDAAFGEALGVPLAQIVLGAADGANADHATALRRRTDVAQAALFTLQTGLALVLAGYGLMPAAVVGHSAGETAAAYVSGLFDFDTAVRVVLARAASMQAAAGPGRMAAVAAGTAEVVEVLARVGNPAALAVDNGPASVVVAGTEDEVAAAVAALEREGIAVRPLPVEFAFHSPGMDAAAMRLADTLRGLRAAEQQVPIVSSVTALPLTAATAGAEHWARGVSGRVRFREAVAHLVGSGFDCFLEIGPQQTLTADIEATARQAGATVQVVSAAAREATAMGAVHTVLADLYRRGATLDWSAVWTAGHFLGAAPTYPWQHRVHWLLPTSNPTDTQEAAVATVAIEPSRETVDSIRAALAPLLGCAVEEVPTHARFLELGADSLTLLRLVTALNERYGTHIQPTQLFDEYPDCAALATAVAGSAAPTAPVAVTPAVASAVVAPAAGPVPADVAVIVTAQLDLMRAQLRALGTAPSTMEAEQPAEPTARPVPAPPVVAPRPPGGVSARAGSAAWTPAQRRYVADLAAEVERRSPTSKRQAGRYRRWLAEARPWTAFRPALKELTVPLTVARARGSRLWDIDGAEYVDYCLGFGAHLFGHSPEFVTEAVRRQLDRGFALGPYVDDAYVLAEQLCRITGYERISLCNTGSEAVMGAVRLARLATGRPKVVYFDRSYHGITDVVLGQRGADLGVVEPVADGVSAHALDDALVLPYLAPESLRYIAEHASDIAAVLVEPVQNRDPGGDPGEFLHLLRQVTAAYGIVLIFDEMITGFRIGLRGAQGHFGVRPDMTTYGKALGGGLPLAAIAGSEALMAGMDGGAWTYGDDSAPDAPRTLFGGTFQRHPLAVAAARAVLDHLDERGEDLYRELNRRARALTTALSSIVDSEGLPFTVVSFGSLWRLQYRGAPNLYQPVSMELMYHSLRAQGVYVWEGRTFFLSTAHDDADTELLVGAVRGAVRGLRESGFLAPVSVPNGGGPSPAVRELPAPVRHLPATAQQRRLWRLCRGLGAQSLAFNETVQVELTGPLDRSALGRALDAVRARHPVLRAVCADDGERLIVREPAHEVLPVIHAGDLDAPPVRSHRDAPYDLTRGPLFRPALVRHAPDRHTLLLCGHHIVLDGRSYAIVLDELATAYSRLVAGGEPPTDEVPWSGPRQPEVVDDDRYWSTRLAGSSLTPRWPTTAVNGEADAAVGPGKGRLTQPVEDAIWQTLTVTAAALGCTPFMLAFCAFAYSVHELTGDDDIVVGVSTDGRDGGHAPQSVGHFSDVIPVRSVRGGDPTFRGYLQRMRQPLLADLAAARRCGPPSRDGSPSWPGRPDIVFDLNPPLMSPEWTGLTVRLSLPAIRETCYAVFFDVIPGVSGTLLDIVYRRPVDADLAARLGTAWRDTVLRSAPEAEARRSEPAADG